MISVGTRRDFVLEIRCRKETVDAFRKRFYLRKSAEPTLNEEQFLLTLLETEQVSRF